MVPTDAPEDKVSTGVQLLVVTKTAELLSVEVVAVTEIVSDNSAEVSVDVTGEAVEPVAEETELAFSVRVLATSPVEVLDVRVSELLGDTVS